MCGIFLIDITQARDYPSLRYCGGYLKVRGIVMKSLQFTGFECKKLEGGNGDLVAVFKKINKSQFYEESMDGSSRLVTSTEAAYSKDNLRSLLQNPNAFAYDRGTRKMMFDALEALTPAPQPRF